MLRQYPCRLLAVAFAAASPFLQVRAQVQDLVPAGTPGADQAQQAVDAAAAGRAQCSCDCCQATQARIPVSGESTQCALVASENCPAKCVSPDPLGEVIVVADDGTIDFGRYCHMTCMPDEAQQGEHGTQCRKVTPEEQEQLLTAGGNGVDPATLNQPKPATLPEELKDPDAPPEAPQLSDAKAMNDAADNAAAEAAAKAEDGAGSDDQQKLKDSGAMVAEASGKQAFAAGMEARLTEAEANSAQALSLANGNLENAKSQALIVTAAQAQVKAAEVQAAIYAKSAAKAASRAEAEMKEIMDIPKKAAELAAAEAKAEVQKEVNEAATNVAIVKSRLAPPPLPVPLAEASVRAAQPYYNAMNKAVAMGNLYEASAHNLQDQAQSLQEQSREVASQAVGYQMAGYGDMAANLMKQAKGMLGQAQAKDAQARKDFAVAEGVRKEVPNYQANAALASARATALANPAGQPPPAMAPPGFLQTIKMHQSSASPQ